VVGHEVLVRGVVGAVCRGDRGHLGALPRAGRWASRLNDSLTDLVNAGGQSSGGFQITAKGVILSSALIGLVNVVLFTALATLGAFVYNVCADLVGGIELTLAERD
jgi:hypothetical protein